MSGLMDKAKDLASNKLNQDAQPGNQVEGSADSGANNGMLSLPSLHLPFQTRFRVDRFFSVELNQVAGDAGVPQQDDQMMDKVADAKVNSDIPFGNN
jgi:hypothetical protein